MADPKEKGYRYDPYKNFSFHIKSDGRYVAGVSKVAGMESAPGPANAGGSFPPAQPTNNVIILERGVTNDLDFHHWATTSLSEKKAGTENPSKGITKDILIEIYNETGQLTAGFNVYRCRVSAYQFIPEQDSEGNAIVIDHMTLENEGWSRDPSIVDPG